MVQNYLTIDVEDYFQVAAFSDIVSRGDWDAMDQRVGVNIAPILKILKKYNVRATFFIVGWIADKHPEVVQTIMAQGHDIGCHSYWHRNIYDLTPEEFREDTLRAKNILEKLANKKITAYRAPSYSITRKTLWALDILKELGFTADSSIFPIKHDIYGIPDSPRFHYRWDPPGIEEYPISTVIFCGKAVPVAGGGYFRLFPYWFTKFALTRINKIEKKPFVFYLHPWEIDSEQPRFNKARPLSKFRHYNNLAKTMGRFERLLTDFDFIPLPTHDGGDGNRTVMP
ncbi:MAG: XrtA system polysaccharide deacetylase [Thermodesulfobacteriota bacterium]|nr:XrtA system polysaccharide deacetylase [Thermodesulfobacteriota bacterium]